MSKQRSKTVYIPSPKIECKCGRRIPTNSVYSTCSQCRREAASTRKVVKA